MVLDIRGNRKFPKFPGYVLLKWKKTHEIHKNTSELRKLYYILLILPLLPFTCLFWLLLPWSNLPRFHFTGLPVLKLHASPFSNMCHSGLMGLTCEPLSPCSLTSMTCHSSWAKGQNLPRPEWLDPWSGPGRARGLHTLLLPVSALSCTGSVLVLSGVGTFWSPCLAHFPLDSVFVELLLIIHL